MYLTIVIKEGKKTGRIYRRGSLRKKLGSYFHDVYHTICFWVFSLVILIEKSIKIYCSSGI